MKFSIGRLMIVVVILAGFFAAFGVADGAKLAGLFVVLLFPLAFFRKDRRLLIAAWIMSLCPFLVAACLYATYVAGWISLGRPPRPSLDDPKFIGPSVDWFYDATMFVASGLFVALLASIVLSVVLAVRQPRLEDGSTEPRRFRLALIPVIWFLGMGWLMIDLFQVLNWFFD